MMKRLMTKRFKQITWTPSRDESTALFQICRDSDFWPLVLSFWWFGIHDTVGLVQSSSEFTFFSQRRRICNPMLIIWSFSTGSFFRQKTREGEKWGLFNYMVYAHVHGHGSRLFYVGKCTKQRCPKSRRLHKVGCYLRPWAEGAEGRKRCSGCWNWMLDGSETSWTNRLDPPFWRGVGSGFKKPLVDQIKMVFSSREKRAESITAFLPLAR